MKKSVKKTDLIYIIFFTIALFSIIILSTNIDLLYYFLGIIPGYVSSYSMEPTLHVGDALIIVKSAPENLRIGDIIVYNRFNSRIVHRIINKTCVNGVYRFLIKGDANNSPDPGMSYKDPLTWLPEYYILGKVVIIIPYIGVIPLYLEKNIVMYYLITGLLIVTFFITIISDIFLTSESKA